MFNTVAGGLILTLKENTLTPAGATFILNNLGPEVAYYGQQYFLQMYFDDQWYDITGDPSWTLELIHINPGEKTELPVDWSNFFGVLPPGNYRFIKEFQLSNYRTGKKLYLSYPFVIE